MKAWIRGLACLGLLTSSTAHAEDATANTTENVERQINVSASLLKPAFAQLGELGGELNIGRNMSAGLSLTVGPTTAITQDAAGDFFADDVFCFGASAQYRYYLLGNFDRGMFVGGDVVWYYLTRDRDVSVRGKEEGIWFGPEVGYKHTFAFGLLLSAAFGAYAPLYRPSGLDRDMVPGSVEEPVAPPVVGPVMLGLNASVGWAL